MKKQSGFISMSIMYSFFLVFALLAATLLANYAHNRLLIREYNNEIKSDLDTRGNNKLARLTNLLRNSSFETGGQVADYWQVGGTTSLDASQRYDGTRSMKFVGSDASNTNLLKQDLNGITIKKDHVYYVQFRIFTMGAEITYDESKIYIQNRSNNAQYQFNNGSLYSATSNPNENVIPPSDYLCITNTKCYLSNRWEYLIGVVNKDRIPNDITNASFVIEQTNTRKNDIFIDCVMLIDLTEAYGEGNEPVDSYGNAVWLNNNISYFGDKYIHNKNEIAS